ncbi:MAG: hypothetical protein ACPG4T_11380, partial [Nannocystaceae bacterium]
MTANDLAYPSLETVGSLPTKSHRHAPTGPHTVDGAPTAKLLTRQPQARHRPDPEVATANATAAEATIAALVDGGVRE